jgi:hypothetical protein
MTAQLEDVPIVRNRFLLCVGGRIDGRTDTWADPVADVAADAMMYAHGRRKVHIIKVWDFSVLQCDWLKNAKHFFFRIT